MSTQLNRLIIETLGRHPIAGAVIWVAVGAFMTRNLTHLYPVLNRRDPHVIRAGGSDRWGGSDQIGGSPRQAGSALTGPEIMALVAKTYRRRGLWDWIRGR